MKTNMELTLEELIEVWQALEVSAAVTRLTIDAVGDQHLKAAKKVGRLRQLVGRFQSEIRVTQKRGPNWIDHSENDE